jgi:hypothetical protein
MFGSGKCSIVHSWTFVRGTESTVVPFEFASRKKNRAQDSPGVPTFSVTRPRSRLESGVAVKNLRSMNRPKALDKLVVPSGSCGEEESVGDVPISIDHPSILT